MAYDKNLYRSIDIDLLPVNIAIYKVVDDDFVFVGFNSSAEKTENMRRDDLLGKKVTEVFPGVKEFGIFDAFKRVYETKQNERFELAFYQDENNREGWRINDIIYCDDETIMAVYHDATKEVHLGEKMESLGYMVNDSDNEYYIFNKNNLLFSYANQSALKNLGFSFEELEELTPVDIKPFYNYEEFKALLENLRCHDSQVIFETKHRRKDGTTYDVEARVQLMTIEGEEKYVATVLDITKRKALEDELESLGNILNNSVNEVYMFDAQNLEFTYFNESASKNIGYTVDEIVKMTPVDIKPSYSTKQFFKLLEPLFEDKQMVVFETEHQRKDGSLYAVEARVQLMKIDNQDRFIAIVMDITKRREKEKALKEHQEMLLYQSKMAAMGEMIGNIAHQWRQPLNTISTISSGMKMSFDLDIYDEKEAKENLDKMIEVTQHLSSTIDDFRNFFKPNKALENFTLESVYEKNLTILKSTFKHSEIKLIENIETVYIKGYFNELTQAILNILNNARDALDRVKNEKLIFIEIFKDDEFGVITIKDNAGGIKEGVIEHIFEPYFTTKHKAQGTGIGLYMTEQIIENHMTGYIFVENEEFDYEEKSYKGCKFTIKIPIEFD